MSQPAGRNLLHQPPMPLSEAVRRAVPAGLRGLAAGLILVAAAYVLTTFASAREFQILSLLKYALTGGLLVGAAVFIIRVHQYSRSLLDRSFRAVAFSATMFGCVMLVVFLAKLGWDAVTWFRETPQLVEEQNARLADEVRQTIEAGMRDVRQQMKDELDLAANEQEKKEIEEFYEKRVFPPIQAQLELTAKERQRSLATDIREDTSSAALLHHFLTHGPSQHDKPQDAGIYPALLGSIYIALITLVVAIPLGVGAAVYLEEYRHSHWLSRIIEVNINNLAAVPAVFYGIMGAFIFVELFFKRMEGEIYTPMFLQLILGTETADGFMTAVFGRSIAARNVVGGGLTLAVLTLPVVIVSSREAIRAVPVTIRHGALALGATPWQVVWHHVLPQARSGILTGVILALSRAIGEAAPLVLFGALLYVDYEPSLLSRFTVLPMQVFAWMDRPSEAWQRNAAMASIVLMVTLLTLNALAIYLRQRARQANQ